MVYCAHCDMTVPGSATTCAICCAPIDARPRRVAAPFVYAPVAEAADATRDLVEPGSPPDGDEPPGTTAEFAVKETQVPSSVTRGPHRRGPLAAGLSGGPRTPSRPGSLPAVPESDSIPIPLAEPGRDEPAGAANTDDDASLAEDGGLVISLIDQLSLNEIEAYDDLLR